MAAIIPDRTADESVGAQLAMFSPLPAGARASVTHDNGAEFARHARLRDELAPGERVIRRGPVADGVRRMAVARLAAGGVTSRQVAAEVGVEASVVRNRVASTAARAGTGGRSSGTRQAGEEE